MNHDSTDLKIDGDEDVNVVNAYTNFCKAMFSSLFEKVVTR